MRHYLAIIALSAVTPVAAYLTGPWYDDATFWLFARDLPHGIAAIGPDRPLMCLPVQWAADAGSIPLVFGIATFLTSLATAAVTRSLWLRIFPNAPGYGPAASLLAVSTVLIRFPVLTSVFFAAQTTVVYGAALWAWNRPNRVTLAVMGLCVAVAGLVSEYHLAAALAMGFVLWAHGRPRTAVAIVGAAVVGYLAFRLIADTGHRDSVSPAAGLSYVARRWHVIPTKLVAGTAEACGGAMLRRSGGIDLIGWGAALAGIGIVTAWLLRAPTATVELRRLAACALAIALGLLPFLAMGRTPADGPESRFFAPVAPLAAVATLGLALAVVRERIQPWIAGAVVLVAVASTLADARAMRRQSRTLAEVAEAIRPRTADGFTLVLLDADTYSNRDYELTAQVARHFGTETGRRLWVLPLDYVEARAERYSTMKVGRAYERTMHNFTIKAEVSRVLVVSARNGVRVIEARSP